MHKVTLKQKAGPASCLKLLPRKSPGCVSGGEAAQWGGCSTRGSCQGEVSSPALPEMPQPAAGNSPQAACPLPGQEHSGAGFVLPRFWEEHLGWNKDPKQTDNEQANMQFSLWQSSVPQWQLFSLSVPNYFPSFQPSELKSNTAWCYLIKNRKNQK